ncbi:MAG: DNA phosphorothioation-dependent restriction protein DptH [Anaerobacillus sp.]|uniref:DNA phosphorothioation-dependent restriction protein DptH n=1 Tax=Anaerobacillus sp. TaxID=1872506 RepID=UPI0039189E1D
MSNQFYNYISELLLRFFKETSIKAGDRFYLQLDKTEDLTDLLEALRQQENVKEFVFQHELGDPYRTFSIEINELKLVVAHTADDVKPDFLVTLRNQVGEQKNVWENTALLSVVSEQLDSIQGGSSDLQKEGMPLHPNYLLKKLKYNIENSTLDKVDQIILLDNMDMLLQEQSFQQITFFEFEDFFSILSKGAIEETDYKKFALFKDSDLDTFTGNKLKERLRLNRELYDYVRKVHDYGLEEEELQKKFSPSGASKLYDEDWNELRFSVVNRYYEEHKIINKKTSIDLKEIKIKGFNYWDRAQKDTSAGNRKRHIVIFNPDQQEEVSVQATFSINGGSVKSLDKDFLKIPLASKKSVEVSLGKINLNATIKTTKGQSTFVRVSYKHDNKANLGAELSIAVVPVEAYLFDNYKTSYLVDTAKNLVEIQYEGNELIFGQGFNRVETEVVDNNQIIDLDFDEQLKIIPQVEAFNDDEELLIKLRLKDNQAVIPIILRNELPESTPISGLRIWKLKREQQQDFEWKNNKLIFGNHEFYMNSDNKRMFEWEFSWVENGLRCANLESDAILAEDISLNDELREAYNRFVTYFKTKTCIPSLCYFSSELKARAEEYLSVYISEVKSFKEGNEAGRRGRDLFKLGTIIASNEIYFTPFHPLMVAYQLKINELLANEELDNSILNRLKPDGLLPFIYYGSDQLYKPDNQHYAPDWMIYKPVKQVSVSDANQYLAKVVEDKIGQFVEHFDYLFIEQSKAPLQVNIINIANDKEVLRGIILWMLKSIDSKGPEMLMSIEVTIYKEDNNAESTFDIFSRTESIEQIQEMLNVTIKSKNYESQDVLRFIREKLYYFKRGITGEYKYAHISFYKMQAQEHDALQSMGDMLSGMTIDGLYTSIPSMKGNENYRSGFGTKAYSITEDNLLTQTAYSLNELSANLRNDGNDSYRKGEAIFSRTSTIDEETLESIYRSSYWVTFVDPNVDLEFFNEYDKNLVVIHYSDQYSSSSRYDAITVTDKSQQYFAVIKEFLKIQEVEGSDQNVKNTIKAFNTFNGEWLLRIIGSKGHYSKEKLSIISAIKYSLAYFDHPDILWVPVSLEEVLRVAGAVSLNKTAGVFTAKNLGVKGSHSDDLLLIGLENSGNDLKLHFYPVEVKIGINKNDVLEKARKQVKQTKKLLNEALLNTTDNSFTKKFYRNFFIQLFISNAKKLQQNGLWDEKNYNLSDDVIERLNKDQYVVSNDLDQIIGEGAILSFQRDAYHRSASLEDGITLINLLLFDGFNALVNSIESMHNRIQTKDTDFVKENFLSYQYKGRTEHLDEVINDPETVDPAIRVHVDEPLSEEEVGLVKMPSGSPEGTSLPERINIENIRILIGKAENSNREVYWEFGNKGLANRHLLISGKSGQGKTYFMQCLLLEKSKQGIPSIVIDYTEGFLPNQLEPEFVEYMGDKLKHKIVFRDKLPINPFKINVRDIGGISLPETNIDIAERIKSIFSAVYKSLGIQQLNAIYEALIRGLETHGENMSLPRLKEVLEDDNSSYAKTALSQIRQLIDRNPFSSGETIDWKDVVESNGEIFIVQLTGYPRDIQLMITEFILWDLWNYSVRFGNKNTPMPVLLDEAQNLDHTENSPSARILTEGRKFGWSGWYATQFLKSQLDAGELARLQNASEKVYFSPPEQEVSNIAASLANDQAEKKKWENRLSTLKKGQCIVHGPVLRENNELSKPTVTIVDISPLSDRI